MLRMSSRVADIFGKASLDYLKVVEPIFKETFKGFSNVNLTYLTNTYNKILGGNLTKLPREEKEALLYLRHFFIEGSKQYHPSFTFHFKENFRELDGIHYHLLDIPKTSQEFLKDTVNKQEELSLLVEDIDIAVAKKALNIMSSAAARQLPFNLSKSDIKRLLLTKKCAYSGVPFEESGDNALTFDRKDTSLGYVKGNVVVCTQAMNILKEELFENRGMDFKTVFKMVKALDPTL